MPNDTSLNGRPKPGFWENAKRYTRYKLVVPMKRSPHSPEYTARGVAMGVFWGLTPLMGVQMPVVTVCWLVAKLHPKLDFHLIMGLIWVWTSNVFTIIPMYYSFYVTGQVMLGRIDNLSGYDSFAEAFNLERWTGGNFWEVIGAYLAYAWDTFGLPLAIGWTPYALAFTVISYHVSVRVLHKRRAKMAARRAAKARLAERNQAD